MFRRVMMGRWQDGHLYSMGYSIVGRIGVAGGIRLGVVAGGEAEMGAAEF